MVLQHIAEQNQHEWQCCLHVVALVSRCDCRSAIKTAIAEPRHVRSYTGVRPRQIACRNRFALANSEMLNVARMQRARVVSALCRRGPRMDGVAIDAHRHRELRINRLYVLPSDHVMGKWIADLDSSVEEAHAGPKEEQVHCIPKPCCEQGTRSSRLSEACTEVGPQQPTEQSPRETGVNEAAPRPEFVGLIHPSIFPYADGAFGND